MIAELFWQSDWPPILFVLAVIVWGIVTAVRSADLRRTRRHHPTQLRRRQLNEFTRKGRVR